MNNTEIEVNFRCKKTNFETISANSSNKINKMKSTYSIIDTINFIEL